MEPQIIATSTILLDLTQRVGGQEVQVTGLLKPGDDPHVYEPVPRDTVLIEQADAIFYNGYNLEPGIIKLIQSSGKRDRAIAIATQRTINAWQRSIQGAITKSHLCTPKVGQAATDCCRAAVPCPEHLRAKPNNTKGRSFAPP